MSDSPGTPPARLAKADGFSGGSYGSSSDQRIHFGLGSSSKIDKLEIDWPSGTKQNISVPGVDRVLTVVEGKEPMAN